MGRNFPVRVVPRLLPLPGAAGSRRDRCALRCPKVLLPGGGEASTGKGGWGKTREWLKGRADPPAETTPIN